MAVGAIRRKVVGAGQRKVVGATRRVDPKAINNNPTQHLTLEDILNELKDRLPQEYFRTYKLSDLRRHGRLLAWIHPARPVAVEARRLGPRQFEVTLVSFDYLGILSLFAGILSSSGFNIRRGRVWTYGPPRKGGRRTGKLRKILDVFEVVTKEPSFDWKSFEQDIVKCVRLLWEGKQEQVRREIHGRIATFFRTHPEFYLEKLYPIQITLDEKSCPWATIVQIDSEDTYAFLYELTHALSSCGINIVAMEIETPGKRIRDRLWVTTARGEKLRSQEQIKELRWAILLTKHFTHLLPQVPDPTAAMEQFNLLSRTLFGTAHFEKAFVTFQESRALNVLSRVLGASQFLWEEFMRTQHEAILPLLRDRRLIRRRKSKEQMTRELRKCVEKEKTFAGKVDALNNYKDREMFRIDLRHLLGQVPYLDGFARELTDLAEGVMQVTHELAWQKALEGREVPKVSYEEPSEVVVLALGKFGGRELGYASDIELMFVYTDAQEEDSEWAEKNLVFYCEYVKQFCEVVRARSEGIFEIDLRLRPYGKTGSTATSLELFKRYYRRDGHATTLERQALVKLRPVAGSRRLGREIEKLKDEFVYGSEAFDFAEALHLRDRQRSELVVPGTLNAKYSAGGLLDIEYLVQSIQMVFGRKFPKVRHPNTLEALTAIQEAGIIDEKNYRRLRAAYFFIRDLINALRIFRGTAKDLRVPLLEDVEFVALARRMGYQGKDEKVRKELTEALRYHMKVANYLYESWVRRLAKQKGELPSIEHLAPRFPYRFFLNEILKESMSPRAERLLRQLEFSDIPQAIQNTKRLFPGTPGFEPFASVMERALSLHSEIPNMDLAWQHWERLVERLRDPLSFWKTLKHHGEGLKRLLRLLGESHYLSEFLIMHPEHWDWVVRGEEVTLSRTETAISEEIITMKIRRAREAILDDLRHIRHRETLRIVLSEMKGEDSLESVHATFAHLAEAMMEKVLALVLQDSVVCILGLGKLGGEELNYGSDVDLLFLTTERELASRSRRRRGLEGRLEDWIQCLTGSGAEIPLYRVDMRLRPHGQSGSLVLSDKDTLDYYRNEADLWEYQIFLKGRPCAGNLRLGQAFLSRMNRLIFGRKWDQKDFIRLQEVKRRFEEKTRKKGEGARDVKMGFGGIRDIEFTIQSIQLRYGKKYPDLREPNTLRALRKARDLKLLTERSYEILREGYIFLRRIENRVQLAENRQIFLVPAAKFAKRMLAKSLGFRDTPRTTAEDLFQRKWEMIMGSCRAAFEKAFFRREAI